MVTPEPWEAFADAWLRAEAALAAIRFGAQERPSAGLFVDDADAGRIAAELGGVEPGRASLGPARAPRRGAQPATLDER